jgi:hypothetical protein
VSPGLSLLPGMPRSMDGRAAGVTTLRQVPASSAGPLQHRGVLMGCTDPARQCLDWHFRPHLAHAVLEDSGNRLRARCPSCGTLRTLTASLRDDGHGIVCGCFNSCPWPALRIALRSAGVPDQCLPAISRSDIQVMHQAAVTVFQQGTAGNRAQTVIRAYLITLGYARWPRGNELLKLASECGVSKTDAYAAKRAGPLLASPGMPVPMSSAGRLSNGQAG